MKKPSISQKEQFNKYIKQSPNIIFFNNLAIISTIWTLN
jgi:hypothetical protein